MTAGAGQVGAVDCLFCGIVVGDVPSTRVLETPDAVAFRDLNAVAPVHVLVVPRAHVADLAGLTREAPQAAAGLLAAAVQVAEQEGLADGYRVVANTGRDAGQTVFHLHLHVLGGRSLGWPPG